MAGRCRSHDLNPNLSLLHLGFLFHTAWPQVQYSKGPPASHPRLGFKSSHLPLEPHCWMPAGRLHLWPHHGLAFGVLG